MHTLVRHGTHRFRRHVRDVWASRGGGFYGFVATLTFLYLEAMALWGDVTGLPDVQVSVPGIIGWLVQNLVTAILNGVWSAIWPVKWIGLFGVSLKSGALLLGAYFLFHAIQPAVLRLLAEPGEAGALEAGDR